ncbi:MAG TPA: type II CAAX endopeptidase family protein [Parafilimonas sp.]|nr:type II CAAX endopeptidase family protein [Parafilimonas sp.]
MRQFSVDGIKMKQKKLNSTKTLITGIAVLIGLLVIVMASAHLLFVYSDHSTAAFKKTFIISRVLFWVVTLLMYLYAVKIEKQPLLVYVSERKTIWFYVLSVWLLPVAAFIAAIIAGILVKLTGLYNGISDRYSLLVKTFYHNQWLFIFSIITAGVIEEILFRGYLLTRLQMLFKNDYMPVIISSVLFGLVHIGYGTVQNVVGPMCIGVVFALYYIRYKRIVPLIISHAVYDFLIMTITFHMHVYSGK